MPTSPRSRPAYARSVAGLLAASSLLVTSCASATQQPETAAGAGGHYPVTVVNCGAEVTFDSAPERLVLLKSASVPALSSLGVLDRAVAKAGAYPDAYYSEETQAQLDDIQQLGGDLDASGHLQISRDVVIAQEPDLVFGEVDNLPRSSLAAVGIPLLEEPALCSTGQPAEPPSFESVYDQLEMYATVFHTEARAQEVIGSLRERVADAEQRGAQRAGRTAAVLYPTVGGGTTYAYGTQSMAHPQLEAAGFTNVFGDVNERVFEVGPEELIGRNPDVLILLHSEGDPQAVADTVAGLPGADQITAVANGDVMVHLMNFTEPATPLAVDGLEAIVERFPQ